MQRVGFGSRDKNIVRTPRVVYNYIIDRWFPNAFIDPCPINPDVNGLAIDWIGPAYVNPPFNDIGSWMQKAYEETANGNCERAIMLVPLRPQNNYWRDWVYDKAACVHIIRTRVKFVGYNDVYKHPLCFIEYVHDRGVGPTTASFCEL